MIFFILCTILYLIIEQKIKTTTDNYNKYIPLEKSSRKGSLIWGFATGYSWKNMMLFISSLRMSGYNGDIVLGLLFNQFIKYKYNIEKNRIETILVKNEWPYYSSYNIKYFINNSFLNICSIKKRNYNKYKWNVYRFSILYCWFSIYGSSYSHIISIDVRDTIFQGDPFKWNFDDAFYLFEESSNKSKIIINNPTNLRWVKKYKGYEKVIYNQIINSGSLISTKYYFMEFMKQFCKFINDNNIITQDQGSLNYAYYSGYFKGIKFLKQQNQLGVVLTTGIDLPEVMKLKVNNGTIYNKDGTYPLIVHQYDRYKNFIEIFNKKYIYE